MNDFLPGYDVLLDDCACEAGEVCDSCDPEAMAEARADDAADEAHDRMMVEEDVPW